MLKLVTSNNLQCFMNLSQQYEAEFGRLTGKRPHADGLYAITVPDATHESYLAYVEDGGPAGFVVVDTGRVAYDIAEFYVIPALRKSQVGRRMAERIFERYPGSWQVRQIEGAEDAYRFWVAVISAFSGGAYTDTVESDPDWGQVRIQRFHSGEGSKHAVAGE